MANYNVRFKEKPNGEKITVFYVDIPCITTRNEDGTVKKDVQRPRVTSALAMSHMYPVQGSGLELTYQLSNGKVKNDKALFATKEEAERACEEVLEMLRKADAGVKDKPKKAE